MLHFEQVCGVLLFFNHFWSAHCDLVRTQNSKFGSRDLTLDFVSLDLELKGETKDLLVFCKTMTHQLWNCYCNCSTRGEKTQCCFAVYQLCVQGLHTQRNWWMTAGKKDCYFFFLSKMKVSLKTGHYLHNYLPSELLSAASCLCLPLQTELHWETCYRKSCPALFEMAACMCVSACGCNVDSCFCTETLHQHHIEGLPITSRPLI